MADLAHDFGGDLSIGAAGDLSAVTDAIEVQQRLVRRLATNAGGYIWQLTYGAGLPAMVGDPASLSRIQGIVTEQMALEAGVDQTQPITVTGTTDNLGTLSITIGYVDAASGQGMVLTLPN